MTQSKLKQSRLEVARLKAQITYYQAALQLARTIILQQKKDLDLYQTLVRLA